MMFEVKMLGLLDVEALFCNLDIASARLSSKGAEFANKRLDPTRTVLTQCRCASVGRQWAD